MYAQSQCTRKYIMGIVNYYIVNLYTISLQFAHGIVDEKLKHIGTFSLFNPYQKTQSLDVSPYAYYTLVNKRFEILTRT